MYKINNVYPHDMRGTLVDNVMNKSNSETIKKQDKGCPYIRAQINGAWAKILVGTGAEISAINQKFINRNQKYFIRASTLPVVNTQIQTATNIREKVSQQTLINIKKEKLNLDFNVIIIKNLMHDAIFGIDILRTLQAKIDIINKR